MHRAARLSRRGFDVAMAILFLVRSRLRLGQAKTGDGGHDIIC
jgi:hypothetical protein